MRKLLTILAVIFISAQLSAQCNSFYDGFETGSLSAQWLMGGGTYTPVVSAANPNVGTYALELTGTSAHLDGLYATFTDDQPNYASFRMRTNNTGTANGYVVIGDANAATNLGILFCYFNSSGQLRFYNGIAQNFPINVNQWYQIELQNIDYVNKTMDVYMDGVLILPVWAFRSNASISVDRIHLYNFSAATSMYDEIIIGGAPVEGIEASTICQNDSVVVNGTAYNAANPSGTEFFIGGAAGGCDSIVTINLTVLPSLTGNETSTICTGDSIIVNGTIYNAANPSGTEIINGVGPGGCDSAVSINLTVLPALTSSLMNTICAEDSIVVNGTTYNAANPSGTEVYTGIGPSSCDSTVTVNLTILPAITTNVSNSLCVGDSVVVNGTTYNAANPAGTEVFSAASGCDSTITVNLTINTIDVTVTNAATVLSVNQTGASYQWLDCDNAMSVIAGATSQTYAATANGNYAVEVNLNGCVDTSACEAVTGVGLVENDFGNNLLVYPNPTDGDFSIDLGEHFDVVTLVLSDLAGKVIQSEIYTQSQLLSLTIEEPAGVYLVIIKSGDKQAVMRLVKE